MSGLLLTSARLWVSPESIPSTCVDVLIEDGRVVEISETIVERGHRERLDVGGRLVTAGWWNCHVDLSEPVWAGAAAASAETLQEALDDMFLSRGFTSVMDLGSNSRDTLPLMGRIADGELKGPRIRTAGEPIHPPRGLTFYTKRSVPWFLWWAIPTPWTAGGARRAVRSGVRRGIRATKLFTGSYVTPSRVKVMPERTASAAVAASRLLGVPVFAHPSNAAGVARALQAGVDVLAHLPDETDDTAGLLTDAAARGTHLIPTLDMFATTVTTSRDYLDPIDEALRGFLSAGGKVLFGTDVGYMPQRSIAGEVRAMDRCGMTAADILRSLTVTPAELLDPGNPGTLVVGVRADLTIMSTTSTSPTAHDFAHVDAVIVGGRIAHQKPVSD